MNSVNTWISSTRPLLLTGKLNSCLLIWTKATGIIFLLLDGMKRLLLLLSVCLQLFACNANEDQDPENQSEEKQKKNVSKRDYSITKAVAYSDLFLDSSAVENYMAEKNIPDSISRRIRSFYNTRNYQFAWFTSEGFTEQAFGFWNLLDHYTTYSDDTSLTDKTLKKRIDNLTLEENLSVSASNKNYVNTELQLTILFIRYSLKNFQKGYVKRKELERFIPPKKRDALYLADSLLSKKHKDNKYFEDINEGYRKLKDQLARYTDIAKNGGWPIITTTGKKPLKEGDSSQDIVSIKRHLYLTGDLPVNDTSQVFNDTLTRALQNYQERFGLKPTGTVNVETVKELNVPAIERVKQLMINLERMRWMPSQPEGRLILVNIPEFVLHVMENGKKVFDMKIVVGKEGHNTMMFTKTLNQVVFSPYWNVPPSIVKDEILPEIEKDPNYLATQNMEIIGEADGLPEIRQLPGEKNSLGKVKFLFPNSYNIYFHDTPAKALFEKNKRAFSHGCIRLSEPEKMAEYLLQNDPKWDEMKIMEAMNSGNEQYVKLKDPVEVFITYYTAWVDETGKLNFREDIYDHDAKIERKMFL
jgi:murein L,D-transpeptidase YcbB/YkuD